MASDTYKGDILMVGKRGGFAGGVSFFATDSALWKIRTRDRRTRVPYHTDVS